MKYSLQYDHLDCPDLFQKVGLNYVKSVLTSVRSIGWSEVTSIVQTFRSEETSIASRIVLNLTSISVSSGHQPQLCKANLYTMAVFFEMFLQQLTLN